MLPLWQSKGKLGESEASQVPFQAYIVTHVHWGWAWVEWLHYLQLKLLWSLTVSISLLRSGLCQVKPLCFLTFIPPLSGAHRQSGDSMHSGSATSRSEKKPQDSAGFWQGPSPSIPHTTRAHSLTSTFCLEITRLISLCLLFPCPSVALGRPGFWGSSLTLQTPISCSLWNVRQAPPPSPHQPHPLLDFPP